MVCRDAGPQVARTDVGDEPLVGHRVGVGPLVVVFAQPVADDTDPAFVLPASVV